MSRETNKGFMMCCKKITAKLSTIVHLLVENITSLAKPKAYLEVYNYIRKYTLKVNSSKPVISPYLYNFLSLGNILRSNRYWWSTVLSYVGNSVGHYGGRNKTGKLKCTSSRNCIYIINLIKGRYILYWVPLSGEKVFSRKSWVSRSENYLIPINFHSALY